MKSRAVIVVVAGVAAGIGVTFFTARHRVAKESPPPPTPASRPVTQPTTAPATQEAAKPPKTVLDFAARLDPKFKDVQEEKDTVTADIAAKLVTPYPVLIDRRGDLWITHPDAPPLAEVLKTAGKNQVHVVRDEIVFVYWARDEKGNWQAQPVTKSPEGFVWHGIRKEYPLARKDYNFRFSMLLPDDRIFVPTDAGAAALIPPKGADNGKGLEESFQAIEGQTPVFVFACMDNAVALRPWDNGMKGSEFTYIHKLASDKPAGVWEELTGDNSPPPQTLHLFALTDGATLVLSNAADGGLALSTLTPPIAPDAARDEKVAQLVEKLNSPQAETRRQATFELSRFGPSAWPVMEQLKDSQTPEAQIAIERLLGLRAKPALGVFQLLPGPVRMVTRSEDRALALYSYGGITYFEDGQDQIQSPALLIVPSIGRPFLSHPAVLKDRKPEDVKMQLRANEVIVEDDVKGPMILQGNHLAAMVGEEYKAFTRWAGTDRARRSVFVDDVKGQSLILDPNILDPTPRLPAWTMEFSDGKTGWDASDHLAIERGKNPWRLMKNGWDALDPEKATVYMEVTAAATRPSATPLLGGADPIQLLAGPNAIALSDSGAAPVAMIKISEDRWLLFDRPGRALRVKKDKEGNLITEATFTKDIPSENVRRVWLDPDGRVCIVHDSNKATVLFPEGRVPPALANSIRNAR